MWNKPQLLIAISDLLILAAVAALIGAAVLWSARLPLFPLREVVVTSELREVRRSELERTLAGRLRGNFFSVNVEAVRVALEQLPWVRHAEVRRRWPFHLEVALEEHVPVAYWGQGGGQLVNAYGEVFAAAMSRPAPENMPVLVGPMGWAPEMLAYYEQAQELLAPLGRLPRVINVSPRLAVQLKLDDGMIVELGRQQTKAPLKGRLERLVDYYPSVLTLAGQKPAVVDLRYPNGFALRVVANAANLANAANAAGSKLTDNRGKP